MRSIALLKLTSEETNDALETSFAWMTRGGMVGVGTVWRQRTALHSLARIAKGLGTMNVATLRVTRVLGCENGNAGVPVSYARWRPGLRLHIASTARQKASGSNSHCWFSSNLAATSQMCDIRARVIQ